MTEVKLSLSGLQEADPLYDQPLFYISMLPSVKGFQGGLYEWGDQYLDRCDEPEEPWLKMGQSFLGYAHIVTCACKEG